MNAISLPDFTEGLVNLEVPADVCASTYSITPQNLQQPHWPYIEQLLATCETLDGSLDFTGQLIESQLFLVSLMISIYFNTLIVMYRGSCCMYSWRLSLVSLQSFHIFNYPTLLVMFELSIKARLTSQLFSRLKFVNV